MRFLALAVLLVPSLARADDSSQIACMGGGIPMSTTMFSMAMSLAIKNADGTFTTIPGTASQNVFDYNECLCDSQDLYAALKPVGFPTGTTGNFEIWVGSNCGTYVSRVGTSPSCVKVPTSITWQDFSVGNTNGGYLYVPIPVKEAMIPPVSSTSPTMCQMSGTETNAIWFLFYQGSPSMDSGVTSCALNLAGSFAPPTAPVNPTAASGDGAISLSWSAPPLGALQPTYYQVLCADEHGNPLPGSGTSAHQLGYTVCLNPATHDIARHPPPTGGSTATTDDGGVTTTDDLGTMSDPGAGGASGAGDGGTVDGATGDQAPVVADLTRLNNLDPAFLCTDEFVASTTSARIDGLTNGQPYYFRVVSIDTFANPGPSPVLTGTPLPVDDLYRRFEEDGGQPQHCFIATAAYGSYESPYVKVLRRFRDRVLLPSQTGAAFVAWYYRNSPPAATWIAAHAVARFVVRVALWPVIGLALLWLWFGPLGPLAALALAAFCGRRFRRWRRSRRAVAEAA